LSYPKYKNKAKITAIFINYCSHFIYDFNSEHYSFISHQRIRYYFGDEFGKNLETCGNSLLNFPGHDSEVD
jgi:hypothetical protein